MQLGRSTEGLEWMIFYVVLQNLVTMTQGVGHWSHSYADNPALYCLAHRTGLVQLCRVFLLRIYSW